MDNSALPPLGIHDSVLVGVEQTGSDLTLFLEDVEEGEYREEIERRWDDITLINIRLVFREVINLKEGETPLWRLEMEGDDAQIRELYVLDGVVNLILVWTTYSPRADAHAEYSFTCEEILWHKTAGREKRDSGAPGTGKRDIHDRGNDRDGKPDGKRDIHDR